MLAQIRYAAIARLRICAANYHTLLTSIPFKIVSPFTALKLTVIPSLLLAEIFVFVEYAVIGNK
jgi:hypothetical protein